MSSSSDELVPLGGSRPDSAGGSPQSAPPGLAPLGGGNADASSADESPNPWRQQPGPAPLAPGSPAVPPQVRPPLPGSGPATANPAQGGLYPPRPVSAAPMMMVEDSGSSRKITMYFGSAFAAVLLVIGFFVFRTPPPVPAPTGFSSFTAQNNSFACETPDGWDLQPTGEAGTKTDKQSDGIIMRKGNAEIRVTMVDVAGQMASELLFGSNPVPESVTGSRAGSLHKRSKKAFANRFKGYEEKAVGNIDSKMGGIYFSDSKEMMSDTQVTEFTATSNRWGLGGPLHGYRASLGGGQWIAAVTCVCSERDFQKLRPAFLRVIASVQEMGKPGRLGGGGDEEEEESGGSAPLPGGEAFPMNPGAGG